MIMGQNNEDKIDIGMEDKIMAKVGILMGSDSDLPVMKKAADMLETVCRIRLLRMPRGQKREGSK